ncbi:22411_t:CDS:2, partial [Entrophospora sp. SA101]
MLDDLIIYCVEEIAFEGNEGCEIDKLWEFVQDFFNQRSKKIEHTFLPNFSQIPNIDDSFKEFCWKEFVDDELFKFEEVNVNDMTIQDIKDEYGENFRIRASPEFQKEIIYGQVDTTRTVTAQAYKILQLIAKQRSLGATQSDMSKELKIDPRSFFHYLKTLCNYGLMCASQNPAYSGKTVYLPSRKTIANLKPGEPAFTFDPTDKISCGVSFNSELIRIRMTEILSKAKNKVMLATDLMMMLYGVHNPTRKQRRFFNRTTGILTAQGFIEKIHVPKKNAFKQMERCFRLIKLYEKIKESDLDKGKKLALTTTEKNSSKLQISLQKLIPGMLTELPLDYQVYQLIQYAGNQGITAAVRRIRRYRYFSLEAFKKFASDNKLQLSDDEKIELEAVQPLESQLCWDPLINIVQCYEYGNMEVDDDFLPDKKTRERRLKRKKKKLLGNNNNEVVATVEPEVPKKRGRPRNNDTDASSSKTKKVKLGRPKKKDTGASSLSISQLENKKVKLGRLRKKNTG